MSERSVARSFVSGELTPELYGRIDLEKFQSGLAMCRNFVVLPHGPVANRAGTEFIREVKTSAAATRLLPFSYSNTQTFVIELGAGYFRFHTQGATLLLSGLPAAWSGATAYNVGDLVVSGGVNFYCIVAHTNQAPPNAAYWYALSTTGASAIYEIPNPYAAADLLDIHYTQSADVLTLVHPNYPPMELRRRGATLWSLNTISFAPTIQPPAGVAASNTTGTGSTQYQYVVTALQNYTLLESDTSAILAAPATNITVITQANPGVFTTSTAHGYAVGDYVRLGSIGGMTSLNGGTYQVMTVPTSTTFTLGTIYSYDAGPYGSGSYAIPLDTSALPVYTGGGTATKVTPNGDVIPGVGVAVCTNDLTTSPNKNTITWGAAANAARYNVYKNSNGLFGYIGQTTGLSFVDNNITPDISRTPPVRDTVMASPGNYPSAVAYFEQRRCFAGSNNQPQNIWMTKSGTESNMCYSIPTRSDDRIAFRIAAREASAVKHLVPVANLVALTPSTEWRVASVNSDSLSPSSISVKAQSYIGANNVMPVVVGNSILFAQNRGGRIREMSYDWRANGYLTTDISICAPHLFDFTSVVDMAYSRAPYPILWCVTGNGGLLGMTYVPEQQVASWHRHDTGNGDVFESVCSVSETPPGSSAAEDMIYLIVRRTINGQSKRYIERMHTRYFATQADAFFVDCGASNFQQGTYTQAANTATCKVAAHGLTNGNTYALQFSNTALNGNFVVAVVDSGTFTVTVGGAAASAFGTVAVVVAAPVTTITGLSWLEGRTVSILADGAVQPQQVVTGGAITLPAASTKVTVGLPITADVQTLPLALQIDNGFGQGKPKNINKAWLRVYRSGGIFAGQSFSKLTEMPSRTVENYGVPPLLKSTELPIVVSATWGTDGALCVRQTDPLPLTLCSLTLETATGG